MERVIGGISCQPVYGGPAYIFRNVVYDFVLYPVKFNQHPAGILIFHNTFVGRGSAGRWAAMWQNTRILNNLFIGGDGGPGVLWTGTPTPTTSVLDYNGWRMHPVSEPAPIWWRFASPRRSRGGSMSHEDTFETLDAFAAATGYESHGVVVDHGVFRRFAPPAGSSGPPEPDLRLREDSIAADRGTVLPNFNDGFAAGAPDLGAFEATAPPPQYGPRP